MRSIAPAIVVLMLLAGCSEEPGTPAAVPTTGAAATSTEQQAREAGAALQNAGREVGEAASAAAGDVRDAAAPAVERAKQVGAEALDATRNGLNDLAKGAACQTARAANDAAGIAANC